MTTSSKRQIPQSVLCPGDTLIRCNGQDISKKGGKSRGRIMVVMPNHFVLPTKVIGDQQLGNLQKLNTDAPELLIDTEEGVLTFVGKFVLFSTKFMSIQCHPKKAQNICTDIYDRALVFSEPVFTPKPAAHVSGTTLRTQISHLTVEESGRISEEHNDETTLSSATPKSISPYSIHFGMSSLADPLSKSSISAMNSIQRTGSTGTVTLSQSSVPKSPTKSSRGRSSAVYRSESSDGSDGNDDDVFHHGLSDEEAGPVRSSARRVSSAAKSMKEMSSSSSGEGSGADSGAEDDSFSDTQKRTNKKQTAKLSTKTTTDASKPRAAAVTSGNKRKSGDSKVLYIDLDSSEGEMAQASPKKKPRSTPASKPTAGASSAKKSTANSLSSAQKKKKSTFSGHSDESGGDDSDASEMRTSGDEAGVRSVPVRSASRRSSTAAIASFKDPSSGSSDEVESSDDVALTSLVGKGRKPAAATKAAKIATTAAVKTTSAVGKTAKSAATAAPSVKRPAAKTKRASVGESDGSSAVDDDSQSDSNSSFGGSSSKKKSSSSAKAAPKKSAKAAAPATKIESVVVKKVPVARHGSTSSSSRKKGATVVDMVSDSESSSHVNDHDDSDFEALLSSKLTYTATASPASTTPRRLVRKFGSQNSGSKVDAICIDD